MNPLYYAIAATVCLCALIYSALHYQRKAAERKKQDECARKVNDIKAAFKATLELFTMQRLMRPGHVKQVYGVVNNYFLYQPITEENTKKLESLANRITITIAKEINMSKSPEDTEWVKRKLVNFAIRLPSDAKKYNKSFYTTDIKPLVRGLTTSKSTFIQRHAA